MRKKIKIINIVGARPNFMKIAPIVRAMEKHKDVLDFLLVHTGQHYDENMSNLFFNQLNIPRPDIDLGVGSGSHAWQTAEIMKKFEPVALDYKPDYVLVVGDVNSTIACGLVAKKLDVKVIHVEAGLRSFDMTMPEEINRILTDRISDLCFVTEKSGEDNLLHEGTPKNNIHFVGNVMIDTLLANKEKAAKINICDKLNISSPEYFVATLHRPSNVDDKANLNKIIKILLHASSLKKVVFPVHPRTRNKLKEYGLLEKLENNIILTEPLGYLEFLDLISNSSGVLTDSGGIQEETTILDIPCLTLRENTERPVTINIGTNTLTGLDEEKIKKALGKASKKEPKQGRIPPKWDGKAAQRIIQIIKKVNNL